MNNFILWLKSILKSVSERLIVLRGKLKKLACRLADWVGVEGLLKMQTCTILVIFLSIFFTDLTSAILALVFAVVTKFTCTMPKEKETSSCHDFVCSIVGIIIGMFISSYVGLALFVI